MTTDPLDITNIFIVYEPEVARRLGITIDDVRERRGVRGEDWQQVGRGHRVAWTEAAVQKAAALLDPSATEKAAPAASGEEGGPVSLVPKPVAPVVVELTRTRMPNTRIVMGRVRGEEGGAEVTVIVGVGKALLFTRGMAILARRREGALYDFEGNPDRPDRGRAWPRTPGRW